MQFEQAATISTLSVDVLIHPIDTLITRIQSPAYTTHYRSANGSLHRTFFHGLYQGFGPTLITGIPAAVAFFTVYEGAKTAFQRSKSAGYLEGVPQPVLHAVSSAVADLVYCAMVNPAEVVKQNAQVHRGGETSCQEQKGVRKSPTLQMVRQFARHPAGLWAGYTALAASHLPSTSLMFCLYESIREAWLERGADGVGFGGKPECSMMEQIRVSALSAAIAGSVTAGLFVPIDVVKTRMRLAAGHRITLSSQPQPYRSHQQQQQLGSAEAITKTVSATAEAEIHSPRPSKASFQAIARDVLHKDGVRGLFRGAILTCVAAAVGSGLYLGCYEGVKLYFNKGVEDMKEDETAM